MSFVFRTSVSAVLLALAVAPAAAQYQPQYQPPQYQPQMQPGPMQPAASQAAVIDLNNRIGMLERQLQTFLRQNEENAHRVSQLEAEVNRLQQQADRVQELERKLAALSAGGAVSASAEPARPRTEPEPPVRVAASIPAEEKPESEETDPAELAYDVGYEHWRAGRHDQAITALRAMASSFPKHRRVSWANNLAGRAMLDKGEPRAAAEALLANYRQNPKGERAADSLFYLGQSLVKLDQPAQACKAYAELEAVYGSSIRDALQSLLPDAKAEANCG